MLAVLFGLLLLRTSRARGRIDQIASFCWLVLW
jgi:NADH:ubiquinone oxidoreductase subunit H